MSGKLVLIPTPIENDSSLVPETKEFILKSIESGALILVEEEKAGRRRWLNYGLPRECIQEFILFNEHTQIELGAELIKKLKSGQDILLMSDCGLPAFCDPGQNLVDLCHHHNIKVTATCFSNSVVLAMALSGFPHHRFIFEGFIPIKKPERSQVLKEVLKRKEVSILMDTAYRLHKLIEEMSALPYKREIFVAMDLNKPEELLLRGDISSVLKKLPKEKKEFILVTGPLHERR